MHNYILFSILFVLILGNYTVNNTVAEINNENPDVAEKSVETTGKRFDIRISEYIEFSDSKEREQTKLEKFYQKRGNKLVWFDFGKINRNAEDLINVLEESAEEGLSPEYYNLEQIKSKIEKRRLDKDTSLYNLATLDMLLTNEYVHYATDMSTGRVKPQEINVTWQTYPENTDFLDYLENALEDKRVAESLRDLRPAHAQYEKLKKAYKKLLKAKMEGAWPLPGSIGAVEENDSGPEVVLVKKRLAAAGDLPQNDSTYLNSGMFDERLTFAVKNFQRNHGLEADGIVGKNTLEQMNIPIDFRLDQIRLNLDRLRWLPDEIGKRDIIVNIPDYKLKYYEDHRLTMEMGVIVGRTTHYTPALKDTITYIVINPTWNVPYSIATEEMLPKIKADPSYLSRNNYKLLRGSYLSDDVVNPNSVDWSEITENNFPFFIVERPGNGNALGRIKFMLPNNYSIYLHDTPADHLFSRQERDFSHGCVRLEKPFNLGEKLLEGQLTPMEIRRILNTRQTHAVVLNRPVAVHLVYQTAWVDDFGTLQFREDLYRFDRIALPSFRKKPEKLNKLQTNIRSAKKH